MNANATKPVSALTKAIWIVLFGLFLLICHQAMLHVTYWYGLESRFSMAHDRAILDPATRPGVVIMGNSHAMMGVAREQFDQGINATSLAEGCVATYYRLDSLLERHDSIHTVILTADLMLFSSKGAMQTKNVYLARYIDYFDLARSSGQWKTCVEDYVSYRLFPYLGSSDVWIDYFTGRTKGPRETAFTIWLSRLADKDEDFARTEAARTARLHFGRGTPYNTLSRQYLRRIAKLCAEHDVQLVLVRFPMSKYYLAAAERFVDEAEWDAFVKPFFDDHPDVLFLDYLHLYEDREDLFADTNHLNAEGRKALTETLVSDLDKRGLMRITDPP
jgi:hypothetical protein